MTTASAAGPRRAARQRLSEEERRAQILRATIQVVARHGFEAASASLIAGQAGVSKGLIWHYFADKTDLMKQAVGATVRVIRDEVAASVAPSTPVPDAIRAYIRTVASVRKERPEEFRAMDRITSRLQEPDGGPAFSLRDYEELYQGQEGLFRRGQAEGDFRRFDTRVMAITYQGAVDAMLAYLDSHPETDVDRYASALADILLAAMVRQPGE
ncbi:MAG: TetR family transcriptional regulator [Actinobacteria bacterium]|nr:TetR family transcriptional regulator [Actinomycetota bacterium]